MVEIQVKLQEQSSNHYIFYVKIGLKGPALIPEGKQFVIGEGFYDNTFSVSITIEEVNPFPELFCSQEEAEVFEDKC